MGVPHLSRTVVVEVILPTVLLLVALLEATSAALVTERRTYWPVLRFKCTVAAVVFATYGGAIVGRRWSPDFRIPLGIWLAIMLLWLAKAAWGLFLIVRRNRHPVYFTIDAKGLPRDITAAEMDQAILVAASAVRHDRANEEQRRILRAAVEGGREHKGERQPARSNREATS